MTKEEIIRDLDVLLICTNEMNNYKIDTLANAHECMSEILYDSRHIAKTHCKIMAMSDFSTERLIEVYHQAFKVYTYCKEEKIEKIRRKNAYQMLKDLV